MTPHLVVTATPGQHEDRGGANPPCWGQHGRVTAVPRIVSLVPSVTETLLAWGIEPVACTRFCEQPRLHHVGGTKDPDVAAITDIAPDLVVVDEEENRREDHDALVEAGLRVHVLAVRDMGHLDGQMTGLADAVGATWEPIGAIDEPAATRHAYVPIWKRPWMALGEPTYGSAVLRALGIANVAASDGAYPEVDLDAARSRGADVVIAPSEPYPFAERHRAQLERVAPVVFVDGRDLLWWGARTKGALQRLRHVLNQGL
jgi:ABC-type Fe3+-hydroxamate transport system substrate-binding protein